MRKPIHLTISFFIFVMISACTPAPLTQSNGKPVTVPSEITETSSPLQQENVDPTENFSASQASEAAPEATQTIEPTETFTQEPSPSPTILLSLTNTAIPSPTSTFEPTAVLRGNFYGVDENHQGSGTAVILQTQVDEYSLQLESFSVTSGPDLHVILAVDDNPYNIATLGDYLDLGELESTSRDQAYALPNGVDLEKYGSVVIYCVPFQAIFAIAPVR